MEAFLTSGEERFAEWVDGEVIEMTVSSGHQMLVGFLAALLRLYAERSDAGTVLTAPYAIKIPQRPSVREPDLLFVRAENASRVTRLCLEGPADVAVEVVSPDSRTRDRRDKLFEYAQACVREYWLIDHERGAAQFLLLGEDGAYDPIPLIGDGRFESSVLPGFWLDVAWLRQTPLPKIMDVLRAWGYA